VSALGAHLGLLAVQLDPTTVLAQSDVQDPGGQGPEFGKAAPVGLVLVLLLLIGTVLLVRNMNRRLRRLPTSFPDPDAPTGGPDLERIEPERIEPERDERG
jgi:hypothetical protein